MRCPKAVAGPLAVPESGTVESDDAVPLRKTTEKPAREEILRRDQISVQKHYDRPLALIEVVQTHAIRLDELTERWTVALRTPRPHRRPGRHAD
ncbi:hypothetical protein AWB74_08676 [Caballeronia arvi]|uniref:Uncharacterized protein n=1 Tax=Caballeronia arvi TaxID=1777135 RepID=A0A158L5G4_9BURK|nr:hypothetical protein AWB74_08676 [Caballeronia arvi]